jgi:hypothetical protein
MVLKSPHPPLPADFPHNLACVDTVVTELQRVLDFGEERRQGSALKDRGCRLVDLARLLGLDLASAILRRRLQG